MTADEDWEASFLKDAREGLALSNDEQERHLDLLESNLARGIAPSVMGDPALENSILAKHVAHAVELGAARKGWLWQVHPLFLVGGGLVVGGLGGLFAGHELSPRRSPAPVSIIATGEKDQGELAREPSVVSPPVEAIQLEDLKQQGPSSSPTVAPAMRSKESAPLDEPAEPTFYEELSYLRRAQAALRGGNPTLALGVMTSLDEIKKVGALDLERRVTKALALCDLGRSAEAKAVSAPIFREKNHSVYTKRLNESCVGALPADSEAKE